MQYILDHDGTRLSAADASGANLANACSTLDVMR